MSKAMTHYPVILPQGERPLVFGRQRRVHPCGARNTDDMTNQARVIRGDFY